jgi:iron complex transport system substrate-binding protein
VRTLVAAVALTVVIGLSACGDDGTNSSPGSGQSAASFPMTVASCGQDVTVDKPVERVVTTDSGAVSLLHAAGGLDKVVARFELDDAPYPPEIARALKGIKRVEFKSGKLSKEAVVARKPDLIIGAPQPGVDTSSMAAEGIALLVPTGLCGGTLYAKTTGDGTEDFEDLFKDIDTYGRLLGTEQEAAAGIKDLRSRISAVGITAGDATDKPSTAGFLYVDDSSTSAYGRASMSHAQLKALGITNVFADNPKRIFDVSRKTLIDRDPDVLVLLAFDQTDEQAKKALLRIPGVSQMKAVRNGKIRVLDYYYSGASTLAINGLEDLAKQLS